MGMLSRRMGTWVLLLVASGAQAQAPATGPGGAPSAMARMSAPGPEARALAGRTGRWDVEFTMWSAPGAAPVVTRGLVAERTMVGPYLHEVMRPAPGSSVPAFQRIDYLGYDRVEGRWKYVSLDTRFPVGVMPAWSFDAGSANAITLQFEPSGFVGFGEEVEGRLMRSDMVITQAAADVEVKQQHFIMADGTGRAWLAVRYRYTRRR